MVSTSEFHEPQFSHRPVHLGYTAPHCWQTNLVLDLAIAQLSHCPEASISRYAGLNLDYHLIIVSQISSYHLPSLDLAED